MANDNILLLQFRVSDRLFGIDLSVVERVVRAVAIVPLLNDAGAVAGVINYEGERLVVIDLNRKFGLPDKAYGPDNRLIILNAAKGKLVLIVDEIVDTQESVPFGLYDFDNKAFTNSTNGIEMYTQSTQGNDLVFICDVDKMLGFDFEPEDLELMNLQTRE